MRAPRAVAVWSKVLRRADGGDNDNDDNVAVIGIKLAEWDVSK